MLDQLNTEVYTDDSGMSQNGTMVFTYKVPSNQSGGEYTIEISSFYFPTESRKIRLRQYSEVNLFITVDFSKETYSPGDSVLAKVKVSRVDGVALASGTALSY